MILQSRDGGPSVCRNDQLRRAESIPVPSKDSRIDIQAASIQRNRSKRSLREPHARVDALVIPLYTMKAHDDAIEHVFNPRELRWERSADAKACAGETRHIRLPWRDSKRMLGFSGGSPRGIYTGHDREVERDVLT